MITAQTEKMIFAEEVVANELARALTETTFKHVVMRVTSGWQVCPVKKIPSAAELYAAANETKAEVAPAKGPVAAAESAVTEAVSQTKAKLQAEKKAVSESNVNLQGVKIGESPKYFNILDPITDKVLYFGKSAVVSIVETSEKDAQGNPFVLLTVARSLVKKRNLAHMVVKG